MANYAYNPTPFSGFTTGPWARSVSGMSFPQIGYFNNVSPEDAYSAFIRSANPSLASEDLMRKLYSNIRSQYTQNAYTNLDQSGNLTSVTNWLDYLKNYNWNKAFARYSPDVRNEATTNFYRPGVRTISF